MTQKDFYITTSIAYTNAPPHIGYAFELILADTLARFYRAEGKKVFFLTGTDEHGKKIQGAAETAGKTPQEYVDAVSAQFQGLTGDLNISHSSFIRTSDEEKHMPIVRNILQKLEQSGDIYKGKYDGLYCVGCEAFITAPEMEDGKCATHKTIPQQVHEENYFFRFSKYAHQIRDVIAKGEIEILPAYRKKEILNLFSDDGVRDISISRPVAHTAWGVRMPTDENQTAYVWVDALLNYVSGAGYGTDDFAKRWPADIQLIGKDIMRFHTMMWPALLLALELELPRHLYVHGFISIEGAKMSKSFGNVVSPSALIERYGADAARYLLLREIASGEDGDFSFEKFDARYAADLQNNIGNLVSRLTTIGEKNKVTLSGIEVVNVLEGRRKEIYETYQEAFASFALHHALAQAVTLADESNKSIENNKLWELAHTDAHNAVRVMGELTQNVYTIACMLAPCMPSVSEKAFQALGMRSQNIHDTSRKKVTFQKPEAPLFPPLKIENAKIKMQNDNVKM